MLLGLPATIVRNGNTIPQLDGFGFELLIPVDADGETLPPLTSGGLFVRHVDEEVHPGYVAGTASPTTDRLEIWTMNVDFNLGTSTVALLQTIQVTDFDSNLCNLVFAGCVPQPGTNERLFSLLQVVMHRPQYRNFGTHESIVLNWVTDVSGADQHGIRWVELRRYGGGLWTLHQEGDHAPDSNNRWMGSIAMDKNGNIALGYSILSTTGFPGLCYIG
jgi:hypothetical protein